MSATMATRSLDATSTSHLDKPQRPLDIRPLRQVSGAGIQRNQPTVLPQGERPRLRLHAQHQRCPARLMGVASVGIGRAAVVVDLCLGRRPDPPCYDFDLRHQLWESRGRGRARSFIAFAMDAFRYHLDLGSSKVYLSSADLYICRWRLPDDAVMTSIALLAGRRVADLHTHALTLALQQYLYCLRLGRSACGINCGNQLQPHEMLQNFSYCTVMLREECWLDELTLWSTPAIPEL